MYLESIHLGGEVEEPAHENHLVGVVQSNVHVNPGMHISLAVFILHDQVIELLHVYQGLVGVVPDVLVLIDTCSSPRQSSWECI